MKKVSLLLVLFSFSFATIINIPDDYSTIQAGIDAASDGDTVLVAAGTYVENINWSTIDNISLIGSGIDSTIIDGGNNGKVIDNSDESSYPKEISNLTIQNGVSSGKGGGISLKMVGELLLKNINIQNNHAEIGGGVYIEGQGSASFVQTIVHFENVIISDNMADTYGGGVSLDGALISSIMKNVTMVNNSAVDDGGGLQAGSIGDYAVIVNSIFWNNQPSNVDGMVFPYYSNIDIPVGSNNIYTDPLFVNESENFNLLENSPCIDAGTDFLAVNLSTYMLPGVPLDTIININDQSYYGLAPDMGAIESNHSSLNFCTAADGTEGVEFWEGCYSIENTITLNFMDDYPYDFSSFPPELFSLFNLKTLEIYAEIVGPIPPEIGNLTSLEYLNLSNNQLTGEIPPEIGNLTSLNYLTLSNNQLTGEIPEEIGNLTNLTNLYLDNNQLTGEIPSSIGSLISLSGSSVVAFYYTSGIDLSNNILTGEIPPEIGDLSNLVSLNFSNNLLNGEIPPEICNLTSLAVLDLDSNQFTGSIPSEIGNLTNLEWLHLSDNQFTGSIPSEIGNLTNLTSLDLGNNQLTEEIPASIGSLINLSGGVFPIAPFFYHFPALDLSYNQLTGTLPESICDLNIFWGDHFIFQIGNNQLCSPYPSCVVDYMGEQDITNCEQVSIFDETLPIIYKLYNGYPNPFNPVTSLRYDLPEDGLVNITIYDMMGRVVKMLVNSSQTAGYKSIKWNATNDRNELVSAGLYLYTIQAGEFRQTKKMVLLK